jgi:hypothetical protein
VERDQWVLAIRELSKHYIKEDKKNSKGKKKKRAETNKFKDQDLKLKRDIQTEHEERFGSKH